MGLFVTVEGPNGSGKSTFINKLSPLLDKLGTVYSTKEPSNSDFGKYVKNNEDRLTGKAYAYLIAADRCNHIENIVLPHLLTNAFVLCDRYIESSLVLQRFDGVDMDFIWNLNYNFPAPDLSIILLTSQEQLQERLLQRSEFSHFEKEMTRKQEVDYYRDAKDYLVERGFNFLLLDNSENNFEENIKHAYEKISVLFTERGGQHGAHV